MAVTNCYDKGHSKILSELMKRFPILSALMDFKCVNPFTDINFQVKFPDRENWIEPENFPTRGDLIFYTDGSLKDGKAGAGIFSDSPELKFFAPLGQLT
jgi:hypothetical protein